MKKLNFYVLFCFVFYIAKIMFTNSTHIIPHTSTLITMSVITLIAVHQTMVFPREKRPSGSAVRVRRKPMARHIETGRTI